MRRMRLLLRSVAFILLLFSFAPFAEAPLIEKITFVDYYEPTHIGTTTQDAAPCTDSTHFTAPGRFRWKAFPVTYFIDTSGASGQDINGDGNVNKKDRQLARDSVVSAFNTWDAEEHPSGQFFVSTSNPSNAKVTVSWVEIDGAATPTTGQILGLTLIIIDPRSKEILQAVIELDKDETWRVLDIVLCEGQGIPLDGILMVDVGNLATHEIGHAIGLGHFPEGRGSDSDKFLTMYPFIFFDGETHKRTLATGDRRGIESLYP